MARRIDTETPEADREQMHTYLSLAPPELLRLFEDVFPLLPPDRLQMALGLTPVDPAAQTIADHLRPFIASGATIQIGVGEPSQLMPKAGAFDGCEQLGIHTELGSPGLARLWQRGIVDNSRKTIHRGAAVAV